MNKQISKEMRKQVNFRILPKVLMLILSLFAISGCSTYPNKFKCGDAKGLGCTMLHEVDKQIDSGQIHEIYASKKCRGKNCSLIAIEEGLILRQRDQAKAYEDQVEEIGDDNNNLHF